MHEEEAEQRQRQREAGLALSSEGSTGAGLGEKVLSVLDLGLRCSGPAGGEMPGKQVDVPVWALQTGLGRT